LGGTEKISSGKFEDFFDYEIFPIKDIMKDFSQALDKFMPDIVFDLSDQPVVNHDIRMKIASFCFAKNASYMGPDFYFEAPRERMRLQTPSISVIGTGKRIGKTAISAFIAQAYKKKGLDVIVVAMGRGGPKEPQLLKGSEMEITPQYLLSLSKRGLHASSDYIEDALMSKITTIGCRRCGGGFGGKVFLSNVIEGAQIAQDLKPDLIIMEGSGASLPDVNTHSDICVVGANQSWEEIVGYMGIFRLMISKTIIITMCEKPIADFKSIETLLNNIKSVNPKAHIFLSIFRPYPLGDLYGKKVVVGMTAKNIMSDKIKNYIEKKYKCKIVGMTFNLSDRPKLYEEIKEFDDFDVFLSELKAAAVDVITDFTVKLNKEIIYMNNVPSFRGGNKKFIDYLDCLFNDIKLFNPND
jgi:cyclic 2,3-diphosphoglycerate synthetase